MELLYPWLLLAIPAYYVLRLLGDSNREPIPYPSLELLEGLPISLRQRLRPFCLGFFEFILVAALALAAARPVTQIRLPQQREARNVLLTIDMSRSMEAVDFGTGFQQLSRADGVKQVLTEFIRKRQDDRLGLVVFGNKAYVQAPLTLDRDLVAEIVSQISPGIAGDGTAIGDGLALSVKRLREVTGNTKAIILLTDGVNNSGQFDPLKAAELAKGYGIKVHTIGIGSRRNQGRVLAPGPLGHTLIQQAEFDEATLKKIAEITGGLYFNAENRQALAQVYNDIQRLELSNSDDPTSTLVQEYFPRAILTALIAYVMLLILGRSVFRLFP